jgi:hypothetical protein
MRILELTLIERVPDFCMSKGETLEFHNYAFKHKDIDQPFYPNFGPYCQLNEIADRMASWQGNAEMHRMFQVEEIIKEDNG